VTLHELQASPNSDYYCSLHYASAQLPRLQSAIVLVSFCFQFPHQQLIAVANAREGLTFQ